jgi:hypothetical protein
VNVNTIWAVVALLNVSAVGGFDKVKTDSAGDDGLEVTPLFLAVNVTE